MIQPNPDHLGSSNVVTDYEGTMAPCPAADSPTGYTTVATGEEESDFLPYGREVVLCDKAPQHYKFTGKERDTESGLDNFGARYDSSNLGRFMTPDWALTPVTVPYAKFGDPQSLNLYAYVENSPVNAADADGHDPPQCSTTTNTEHTNSQTCDQSRQAELDEAAAGPYKQGAEIARAYARVKGLFDEQVEGRLAHPFLSQTQKLPHLRVPHPCVLCKGGNHELLREWKSENRNPVLR